VSVFKSLVLVVIFSAATVEGRHLSPSRALVLTHVTVIDCTGAPPRADVTVVIADGRITALRHQVKVPQDARLIDAKGKFLIPGLWDMHVHLAQGKFATWARPVFLPLLVANGVTGVRDMGGDFQTIQQLRKEMLDGVRAGPQIVAAGALLSGPPDEAFPGLLIVTSAATGRQAVLSQKLRGVDFIKVLSFVPRDAYFAIADEAKKQNLDFVGHVPESISAAEASDAGQRSIEHFTGIFLACSRREEELRNALLEAIRDPGSHQYAMERIGNHLPPCNAFESYDPEKAGRLFAVLAANHTWQVPTLVSAQAVADLAANRDAPDPHGKYIPAELQAAWREELGFEKLAPQDMKDLAIYFDKSLSLVGPLRRAGVEFMAGTDTPAPPAAGFALHDELALLVKGGLTPEEALETATRNPARFLGRERDLGTVEAGKIADLVLLNANPLEDIHNTTKISAVILHGQFLDRRLLDGMTKDATAAGTSKTAARTRQ